MTKKNNTSLFGILGICLMAAACCINAMGTNVGVDTLNIENEAVRRVMLLSDSKFSETKGGFSQKFFDEKRTFRPDQPTAKTIEFADETAQTVDVMVATDKKFKTNKQAIGCALYNGHGSYNLTNLIPGQAYYYKVVTNKHKVIAKGKFYASGQVRMLAIDGAFNVRDLGGWKGLGGHRICYGQLYRGGSLGGTDKDGNKSDLTNGGKEMLRALGIGAQLDLRAKTNDGLYRGEGSLHSYAATQAPVAEMDFNNTMTDLGAYNQDMSVISDVAWIIYELCKGRPVYFNCRQGADRTGTIAFVLEGLLGCYEYSNAAGGNQMALDYELTGFSQANLVDNWKVNTSCRPASEAYANRSKLFRKLLELEAVEPDIKLETLQQKCYYYLNRYVNGEWRGETLHIDSADLDWFIMHMLQMSSEDYLKFRPSWATRGSGLTEVGEARANVLKYQISSIKTR